MQNWPVSCYVGEFCFYGGKKTRAHYVCLVLIVLVGIWLGFFLWGRGWVRWEKCARKWVFYVVVFEGLDMLAELGGVSVFGGSEWRGVVSVSRFVVILCESEVCFGCLVVFILVTVAWYITDDCREFSSIAGMCSLSAVAGLFVVNGRGGSGRGVIKYVSIDAVRMRLLWLSIICFVVVVFQLKIWMYWIYIHICKINIKKFWITWNTVRSVGKLRSNESMEHMENQQPCELTGWNKGALNSNCLNECWDILPYA